MLYLGDPIHLIPGVPEDYQKERPDEWVFRLLGLPIPGPGEESPFYLTEIGWTDVEVMSQNAYPPLRRIKLRKHYMDALKAWARRKMYPTDDIEKLRVLLIIASPDGKLFLVQIKDDEHPVQAIRGRMSLYSAHSLRGEDVPETLSRFVFKEIKDPDLAMRFLLRARRMPWQMLRDPAQGMILCACYVSVAPSVSSFKDWCDRLVIQQADTQAVPELLHLEQVRMYAERERCEPGAVFVASQHELLLHVANMLQ